MTSLSFSYLIYKVSPSWLVLDMLSILDIWTVLLGLSGHFVERLLFCSLMKELEVIWHFIYSALFFIAEDEFIITPITCRVRITI